MTGQKAAVLSANHVKLGLESVSQAEAIEAAGRHLEQLGLVEDEYVKAMHRREETVSTYMGNGVALPHGTLDAKEAILGTGIVVHQYPSGVTWGDSPEPAHLVIGLAADSDDHVEILSQLAEVLQEEEVCEQLWVTEDLQFILDTLLEGDE